MTLHERQRELEALELDEEIIASIVCEIDTPGSSFSQTRSRASCGGVTTANRSTGSSFTSAHCVDSGTRIKKRCRADHSERRTSATIFSSRATSGTTSAESER